jgi:hypothetical protein
MKSNKTTIYLEINQKTEKIFINLRKMTKLNTLLVTFRTIFKSNLERPEDLYRIA